MWSVGRHLHWGDALEAVDESFAAVAIERFGADPIALLIRGLHVLAGELALASAIDDVGILRVGDDGTGFASGADAELLTGAGGIAGDDDGGVILLRAVEAIGVLIIDGDLIDFGGGLIVFRTPGSAAIDRDNGTAIVCLQHVIRIFGIDPDVVIVGVRAEGAGESLAGVSRFEPAFVAYPDGVGIVGIDTERVVVERARDEIAGAVDELPGCAGVFRAIQAGAGFGFDQRVDAIGFGCGEGDVRTAEELGGEAACRAWSRYRRRRWIYRCRLRARR